MDWIERVFHLNPDGGSGSLELSIMIGVAIAIVMALGGAMRVIPTVRSSYRKLISRKQHGTRAALDRFDG